MKLTEKLKLRALVGVRMRICSMTGSFAVPPIGSGQPGAFGRLLPFAESQSPGKPLVAPSSFAAWKSTKPGAVWPGAAALPVERTANAAPARTVVAPKPGRIDF